MRRRPGLFYGTCLESGWLKDGTWADEPRERRLTKEELREAYRVPAKHADIRLGRPKP